MAMDPKQWREYVQIQLDKRTDRAKYISRSFLRLVPLSLIIGIIASIITIKFWGAKEWTRMMLQLILGVTLATAVFAPFIRKLEKEFNDD